MAKLNSLLRVNVFVMVLYRIAHCKTLVWFHRISFFYPVLVFIICKKYRTWFCVLFILISWLIVFVHLFEIINIFVFFVQRFAFRIMLDLPLLNHKSKIIVMGFQKTGQIKGDAILHCSYANPIRPRAQSSSLSDGTSLVAPTKWDDWSTLEISTSGLGTSTSPTRQRYIRPQRGTKWRHLVR